MSLLCRLREARFGENGIVQQGRGICGDRVYRKVNTPCAAFCGHFAKLVYSFCLTSLTALKQNPAYCFISIQSIMEKYLVSQEIADDQLSSPVTVISAAQT
jgi:hypothetical protein